MFRLPPPVDNGPRYSCRLTNADLVFDCLLQTGNAMDDAKRERKRKEIAGRLSREMGEHRDECVFSSIFPAPGSSTTSERSLTLEILHQCRKTLCGEHSSPGERWGPDIHSTGNFTGIQPTTIPTYDRAVCITHTDYHGRKTRVGNH